jgi:hypothetical protein
MRPVGGHDHACSLLPNGSRDALAGAGGPERVRVRPGLEPAARRAESTGGGRRAVAGAHRAAAQSTPSTVRWDPTA